MKQHVTPFTARPRSALGFTLMELMVVLSLAGVLIAIAAPNFGEFRRNSRVTNIGNDFLAAVLFARTEAIKRQGPVAICPSDGADGCTTGDFTSWIVFVDTNNNCTRGGTEAVLKRGGPIDGLAEGLTHSVSNGVCISFAATGFRQTIAGKATAARTIFCDERGLSAADGTNLSAARGVMVRPTGRARISRDIESGSVNDITDWGLACPGGA